jgi:hypothetical protein
MPIIYRNIEMMTKNSVVTARMKVLPAITCLLALLFTQAVHAGQLDDLLNRYQQSAPRPFSAESGKAFWTTQHTPVAGKPARSCSVCHSADLKSTGKHINTGKIIQPMAPAVNPTRLSDSKKIEKWLLRNCKWVLGRECTAQEKGDVLTFMNNFNQEIP